MTTRAYAFLAALSFILLAAVLAFHFHIVWLPLGCFLAGFLVRVACPPWYLEVLSFCIPVLPILAGIENQGFPLNYLLLPLFMLSGVAAGEIARQRDRSPLWSEKLPRAYGAFLLLLAMSFVFVMLRWSNVTLSPLALFRDTPVSTTGQRVSFAVIFPVVELALFVLSPLYFLLLRQSSRLPRVVVAFLCGQSLSVLYSLFQHWLAARSTGLIPMGFASDPTAFGFLCSFSILLAWYLAFRHGRKALGTLFVLISLAGILNSATRIGFAAVLAVLFLYFFSSRRQAASLAVIAFLFALVIVLYALFFYRPGFNSVSRLMGSIDSLAMSIPNHGGVWVRYSKSGAWGRLPGEAQSIAVGDMDGDGRRDLLESRDGQGLFWRRGRTNIWTKLASPASLFIAADLDHDGTDDLVGSWPEQQGVWVKYSRTKTWSKLAGPARGIAAGDLDGDGRVELLATWDGQGVFRRESASGAWVRLASPAAQIASCDVDRDRRDDLIGVWPEQNGVWAFSSRTRSWIRLFSSPGHIAVGDTNGDGACELLVAWEGKGIFARDPATGRWTQLASPAARIAACDLDDDRCDDLIGVWPPPPSAAQADGEPRGAIAARTGRLLTDAWTALIRPFSGKRPSFEQWNELLSGRLLIWAYSWEWFQLHPLSGLGAGNFVFWVMSRHRDYYIHHLPANQYLLILSSTGLLGLAVFFCFCGGLFARKGLTERFLLGVLLVFLFFNDYLWFAENFLLFWLFASLGVPRSVLAEEPARRRWPLPALLAAFLLANLFSFRALHPQNWAQEAATAYDYGFSYREQCQQRSFRWTGEKAGLYVRLEPRSSALEFQIACGAPLAHLPGKRQQVEVYWRGKLYRRIVFTRPGVYRLRLEDGQHPRGFLEFRVWPTFNLKKLGLGAESRDLGVQLSGPLL